MIIDNTQGDTQNNTHTSKPNLKKITGERIALLLGGTLIGALVIGFGFKMATPVVKKVCQSILAAPDKGSREARVSAVEAIPLKPGTISKRITTVGKLRANESVTIKAEMQGRIKEITFKEGTQVKKGDILIRFDDEELQAELARAEADVEYREVKFKRLETLQAKSLGKGTEYDEVRGGLNIAKAQLEQAKAKLEKTVIKAPFEGQIGLINVSVGAIVDASKELVTLVDFDPMKIEFKIPEKFIYDIGAGQSVELKLDSRPDQIFRATVEALDSQIDPLTHSLAVHATISNEDGQLKPGLFVTVSVIVGIKNDALLIPEAALGREGDIEFVWVVINGKAGRKRVLTGTKENNQVEVIAGLRPDELVVTSGQLKLGEGTAVKITNMGGADVELADDEENQEGEEATIKGSGSSPAQIETEKAVPEKENKVGKETPKSETPATPAPEINKEAQTDNKIKDEASEKDASTDSTNEDDKEASESRVGEKSPDEKSFWGKARDYVVNKFTGN